MSRPSPEDGTPPPPAAADDAADSVLLARPSPAAAAFTLLPLGTGGGPFETDLSAYLLKPACSAWASGCVSLEAGSGIGALVELLGKPDGRALWEQFGLNQAAGDDHGEAWMAGKVMQCMRSYLITHAHLDHTAALILGSGGLPPPRPPMATSTEPAWANTRAVYGSLETLVNLQSAFEERIWPPIAGFEAAHGTKVVRFVEIAPPPSPPAMHPAVPEAPAPAPAASGQVAEPAGRTLRSRKPASTGSSADSSVTQSSPLLAHRAPQALLPPPPAASSSLLPPHVQAQVYTNLPTSPPISVLAFPISHGKCAAARRDGLRVEACCGATVDGAAESVKGAKRKRNGHVDPKGKGRATDEAELRAPYEASAFFVRLDEAHPEAAGGTRRREFCFFGDVEPDSISLDPRNRRVWEEVACRFRAGILDSVFIECSYDNSRPDELLYGHLCPRHVLAELAVLHELLEPTRSRPSGSAGAGLIDEPLSARLRGLRVHIIHVKETLEALTTDGGGIRGRVLRELEEGKQFFERGILSEVEFKVVKRGELLTL